MSTRPLKIVFYCLDEVGHMNACIGLAQALSKRGHRIQFLISATFKGQVFRYGFEEFLLYDEAERLSKLFSSDHLNQGSAEILQTSGMISDANSLEKMKIMCNRAHIELLYKKAVACSPQIEAILEKERPNAIVFDHILVPPPIYKAKVPYIFIHSANPINFRYNPKVPPAGSGYATDSDPATWVEFQTALYNFVQQISEFQNRLNAKFNYEPPKLPISESIENIENVENVENVENNFFSPYLSIYGYPEELDYPSNVSPSDLSCRVDAFCRETPGSVGSIDFNLNQRIVSVIAKTPYKCIVSKGVMADSYDLPDNCWGQAFLPQTQILPLVDLVITHGGNNTVTETFSLGKPMIVMPLFMDQYDNAQRIQKMGFGARIEPYSFQEQELRDAIDRLINDPELKQRLANAAKRIQTANSKEKACIRIEQVVEQFRMKNSV